jgi:hypothetical protein
LVADEAGFSRIAHGQYAIFIARREKQLEKTLKFSKIHIQEVSDEEHSESEFYYPEVKNEEYETNFYQFHDDNVNEYVQRNSQEEIDIFISEQKSVNTVKKPQPT